MSSFYWENHPEFSEVIAPGNNVGFTPKALEDSYFKMLLGVLGGVNCFRVLEATASLSGTGVLDLELDAVYPFRLWICSCFLAKVPQRKI